MKTVTAKTKAWLTEYSTLSPKDLLDGCISGVAYHVADMKSAGWTLIGDAEITIALIDEKEMVDNKVAALREEVKAIRAEATAKATRIESQIQSLLAITCD